jgi:sterol 24-C-methyltransferase
VHEKWQPCAWETLRESIIRHEHYLASKLNVRAGCKVLDVGCGVGGAVQVA